MLKRGLSTLFTNRNNFSRTTIRSVSLYEPVFLNDKLEIPEYKKLCIRLKGYDYCVLDAYARFIKKKSRSMGFSPKVYPVPARVSKVKNFKPNSNNISSEFELHTYHRVIEINDVPITLTPIFIEYTQLNLPSAVHLSFEEPSKEEEEFRYVPDLTLMTLQKEVAEIEKARDERKKK